MKYFPLEDPISHIDVLPVDKSWADVHVFIDGKLSGILRVARHRLDLLLGNTFAGQKEVVEIDDGLIVWHGDYAKRIVVSRNGDLVRVVDLEHRDE
jgi:hypothetical protein